MSLDREEHSAGEYDVSLDSNTANMPAPGSRQRSETRNAFVDIENMSTIHPS